jgi:hypothetical protein
MPLLLAAGKITKSQQPLPMYTLARLNLQGQGLARLPQAPLEPQHRLLADQLRQPGLECLPLPVPLPPQHHRGDVGMAVVVMVVIVVIVRVVVVSVLVRVDVMVVLPVGRKAVRMVSRPVQNQRRIDPPPGHRQHTRSCPGPGLDPLHHIGGRLGGQPVCPADQHQISRLQLILVQLLEGGEVIEAGVGAALYPARRAARLDVLRAISSD